MFRAKRASVAMSGTPRAYGGRRREGDGGAGAEKAGSVNQGVCPAYALVAAAATETGAEHGRYQELIARLLDELQRQQGELAELRARVEVMQAGSAGASTRMTRAEGAGEW
jgi:hypothetical protein